MIQVALKKHSMKTKKIALFGTNTQGLWEVIEETLRKGHSVTAIVDNPGEFKLTHPNFIAVKGNLMNPNEVARYAEGHDLVMCLHDPALSGLQSHVDANRAIITGARKMGIEQVISLGHPISLKLENTKDFFDLWKSIAHV